MEDNIKSSSRFKLKINISEWKEIFKPRNFSNNVFLFLEKKGEWLLILLMIILTGYCCYIWYTYVYHNEWPSDRKQEYINSKDKGVTFQKNKFDDLILEKEERANRFHEDLGEITDIFRIKE